MSSLETVKTLITALQSGDMELAADTMADNFTQSGFAPKALDKREFLAVQSELLAAMPDFSYNLDGASEEGDMVRAFVTITGTHTNALALPMFGLQNIAATGLAITLSQVETHYHVEDGKVASMTFKSVPGDGLSGLLQQVGAEIPLLPRERNIAD